MEEIKLNGDYWIDKNDNKWDKSLYSREQAIELSKTLTDCKECINCEYCIECINCEHCIECIYCEDCKDCRRCTYCTDCDYCEKCIDRTFSGDFKFE